MNVLEKKQIWHKEHPQVKAGFKGGREPGPQASHQTVVIYFSLMIDAYETTT